MPGKGTEGAATKRTASSRAGLTFNVGRMTSKLKKGRYARRISPGAGVFLTSTIEYLMAEVLELSGNMADNHKKSRISPRHIFLAIHNDEELHELLGRNAMFPQGGVIPHIHPTLLMKKKNPRRSNAVATEETEVEAESDGEQEKEKEKDVEEEDFVVEV